MPDADGARPHRGRSVVLLAGASALSALSPLLALPLVARTAGPEAFANIATGQALGTLAATVIAFGWAIRGPVLLARSDRPTHVLAASLLARALIALVALPAVAVLAVLATVDGHAPLTALSAVAFALPGFSLAWYAVGVGDARISLAFDALPRLVANVAGASLATAFDDVSWYPATILVVSLSATAAGAFALMRGRRPALAAAWGDALGSFRVTGRTALTSALLTVTETAPLTALGLAGSPVAIAFAPFDRVLKYGYIAVYMVAGSFQGWVSSASGALARRRMRAAVGGHAALGAVLGLGFAVLGPVAVPVVLGPEFGLTAGTAAAGGVALALMTVTTATGLCVLVPTGRDRLYAASVTVGALIVIPAVLLGAGVAGVTGAAAGIALAQLVVCATMLGGLLVRRPPVGITARPRR
ncbi:hypothetical protein QT381_00605 [Galbitalea sp. SE-J8]|uniref:hypothetical protein n=1 Tax=Galbitalea sp. SE-J8 TaxID=3054952 RepID=UPI00259CCFCB|nr:hypothetical protein [Galbitalea sp. SE-J8]MDM4761508.1 hypothetical protein [Galbitalea sp. SE-J8]